MTLVTAPVALVRGTKKRRACVVVILEPVGRKWDPDGQSDRQSRLSCYHVPCPLETTGKAADGGHATVAERGFLGLLSHERFCSRD
jgi:hypothetical protein